MKINTLLSKVILTFAFFAASYAYSQNYQTSISDGIDRDHYSVVISTSNSSRHVLAGTEENTNGDTQLHVLEIDANGIPVWEKRYDRSKDDQVFDIAARTGGYVITGYSDNNGNDEILVMLLGPTGNIVQQNTYDAGIAGMQSYGVHVIETTNDPIPGYLVTGFALAGQGHTDSKQGIVMKLTSALNVQWIVAMDSSPNSGSDADLNGHGLEVPGTGYFISGSTNGDTRSGNDYTQAQATMLKYDGSVNWQKSYAETFLGVHRFVSTSAIYDADQNEIFQLGNSTHSHHFFVNVFDANSGVTNVSKRVEFGTGSTLNTQGFEIIESIDEDNYCIAGYFAIDNWISTEEPTLGLSLYGSPVFLMEVQKASQAILWDRQYNVPNLGFSAQGNDIFSAYTGIQTHIYTPNIVLTKEDNTGFTLATRRKNVGNTYFDLEVIDINDLGDNQCDSDVPVFVSVPVIFDEISKTLFSNPNSVRTTASLQESTPMSSVGTCGSPVEICEANANFSYTIDGCEVQFNDLSSGIDLGCHTWSFGDGNTSLGIPNPSHVYSVSGTYLVCLEVCCKNGDGTYSYSMYCDSVTVECEGTSCTIPPLTDYFAYEIGSEDCFQYFFEVNTLSNPDLCYNWFVDGTLVGTGGIFDYTFPANLGYEVCLEIFCCNDPSMSVLDCDTIEVGCEEYTCGCVINDILPNGDFENSIPVTSGLPTSCTCTSATVCVGHEPKDKCSNPLWIDDLWDHTLGNSDGNYLIVEDGTGIIWTDNVTVTPGSTYIFEFWEIREVSDNGGNNSVQTFDIRINGAVIGSFNTATAQSDVWTLYCLEWTADASVAAVEIVQTSGTGFNDYGIDDIQFGKCAGSQFAPSINGTDVKFGNFELNPNPASRSLNVKVDGNLGATDAEIYSPDGKLIRTLKVGLRSSFSFNVDDLTDGTYLIRIGGITKRFVVSH